MQVFRDPSAAKASMDSKKKYYLNSVCPYNSDGRPCGNWCALFYLEQAVNTEKERTSSYVILGCKAGEKRLYIDKIVEE